MSLLFSNFYLCRSAVWGHCKRSQLRGCCLIGDTQNFKRAISKIEIQTQSENQTLFSLGVTLKRVRNPDIPTFYKPLFL